jgi:flagellar motor component MotA
MTTRMTLALIFVGTMLGAAISFGGPVLGFIDLPSAVLVLGLTAGGTIMSYTLPEVGDAFRCAVRGTDDDARAARGHKICTRMADIAVASGLVGTVIGLVQMLQNLEDPTAIGPAMAVALLTLLYGVILGELIFRGLAVSCRRDRLSGPMGAPQRGAISIYALIGSLFILLFCFSVMMLAMASFDAGPDDAEHPPSSHDELDQSPAR